MAPLPPMKPKTSQDPSARVGGTFLTREKFPEVAEGAPVLHLEIDNRFVSREAQEAGQSGPRPGRFGIDIPVHHKGVAYLVTVPDYTEDYGGLLNEWGNEPANWCGQSVTIWLDEQTGYVRFAPTRIVVGVTTPPAAPRTTPTTLVPHTYPASVAPGPAPPAWSQPAPIPARAPLPGPSSRGGYSNCEDCGTPTGLLVNGVPLCRGHADLRAFREKDARDAQRAQEAANLEAAERQRAAELGVRVTPPAPPAPAQVPAQVPKTAPKAAPPAPKRGR